MRQSPPYKYRGARPITVRRFRATQTGKLAAFPSLRRIAITQLHTRWRLKEKEVAESRSEHFGTCNMPHTVLQPPGWPRPKASANGML